MCGSKEFKESVTYIVTNICVKVRNDDVNEQMQLHTYVMNTDIARTI